ncbi:hypothetical protein [Halomonas denitrificans]|uniref:hypothetical protein n=1 Tax=Halomonas denitrificans TaxID=370769 RepID=UPI0013007706|nr:hypothetical protein [Halomonas denitrificans]
MRNELKLSSMFFPVAMVAAVSIVSITASLILAFLLTTVVASKSIYYSIPLVLFGAGFQLIGIYSGVHYGWFILLSALLGAFYQVIANGILRVYTPFGMLFLVILILSFIHLLGDTTFLERYFGLIAVLVYMVVLLSFADNYTPQYLENKLLLGVAFSGLCMAVAVFVLFSSQELSLARDSEMSLAIGDTQSSPRLLTTVLGFVLTITSIALAIEKSGILPKLLYLVSSVTILMAMAYAGSRMPLIATFISITIGLFVYLLINFRELPAKFFLWVAVFLLFITALVFYVGEHGVSALPFVPESVDSLRIFKTIDFADNGRLIMWGGYLEQMDVLDMLFGIGLGTFGNPHSFWIGAFIAFGIVGVVPIIFFILANLFRSLSIGAIYPVAVLTYIILSVSTSSDIDRMQPWIIIAMASLLYVTNLHGWAENETTEQ